MNAIKNELTSYLMQRYPFIRSENSDLSSYLSDYQALSSKPNLMSYLRLRGINASISIANLVVSYNAGDYMSIIAKTADLNIANKGLTQIGLSVQYQAGLLEIFAAFIW